MSAAFYAVSGTPSAYVGFYMMSLGNNRLNIDYGYYFTTSDLIGGIDYTDGGTYGYAGVSR
jgi:hypothetical protein